MDDLVEVRGPFAAAPAVQHCDAGNHPLRVGEPWWLVTDTSRGWFNNTGAACAGHVHPAVNP